MYLEPKMQINLKFNLITIHIVKCIRFIALLDFINYRNHGMKFMSDDGEHNEEHQKESYRSGQDGKKGTLKIKCGC